MQRKGGRLGLVLVAGELLALAVVVVDGFYYGWLSTSNAVMISHVKGAKTMAIS
jgi:hypothetical protein